MMEEGLSTLVAKSQKLNNEGNVDCIVDRISNLPDTVIKCILNSLETKNAVRTSVLSRKWHSRWMSVTNLNFIEFALNMNQKRPLFMDFVERVIALREPSDLDLFALACEVLTDAPRINSWVSYAVNHNVQHLLLQLSQIQEGPFELPHCLFTCDTLKKAVIVANTLLKLPSSIHFSNLKFLTLCYVAFPEHKSTQQLFCGLPVLEELTLDRCTWWNVKTIAIDPPMLLKLVIIENEADPANCRFIIFAKNLKSFYYTGTFRNDYYIFQAESLVRESMGLLGTDDIGQSSIMNTEVAYRAYRHFWEIFCVEELILTPYVLELITYAKRLYASMPEFHKATCLGFHPPGKAINFGCGTLAKFLQKFPCLEILTFQTGICLNENHEDGNWMLDPVPSCFSSHLKFIRICQFRGTFGELQIVKSLLESAENLVQMDIICDHGRFSGYGLNHIQMLHRASANCTLNYS